MDSKDQLDHYVRVRDNNGKEIAIFNGLQLNQAALKAAEEATRISGWRERGPKKDHVFKTLNLM
jgi:hypothetical protein